jgi:hypothetical protein
MPFPRGRKKPGMCKWLFTDSTFRHLLISVIVSVLLVGSLLGNAYMVSNVGYSPGFEPVGEALFTVAIVVAIPPWLVLVGLSELGLEWETRGRENFILLNPGLWIYCVIFYTLFFFAIFRLRHRYRSRRKT